MKFISKRKNKNEEQLTRLNNEEQNEEFLKPFAVLQQKQIEEFSRGLLANCYSLYDLVYDKTGVKSFTARTDEALRYKSAIDLKEYTYLAGLEALFSGIYYYRKHAFEFLEYGEGTLFDEKNCSVRYLKEQAPFKKQSVEDNKHRTNNNYTIQFFYESPLGNFLIKQNQINNDIYEIYIANSISDELYTRLINSIENVLGVDLSSLEKGQNSGNDFIAHNNESIIKDRNKKLLKRKYDIPVEE